MNFIEFIIILGFMASHVAIVKFLYKQYKHNNDDIEIKGYSDKLRRLRNLDDPNNGHPLKPYVDRVCTLYIKLSKIYEENKLLPLACWHMKDAVDAYSQTLEKGNLDDLKKYVDMLNRGKLLWKKIDNYEYIDELNIVGNEKNSWDTELEYYETLLEQLLDPDNIDNQD